MSNIKPRFDFLYEGGLYEHHYPPDRPIVKQQRTTRVHGFNPSSPMVSIPRRQLYRRDRPESLEWGGSEGQRDHKLALENFDFQGRYVH
jgi:hypothetical protein